ncbi:MAG: DHH family phosphoesterase [Planctomycetota bacterium]
MRKKESVKTTISLQNSTEQKLNELRTIAEKTNRLLTVIYGNPDPDALASAFALNHLLCRNRTNSTIAYTGEVGRLENKEMIRVLKIPAVKFNDKMLSESDLVANVDCQPSFFSTMPDFTADIVIDHHPKQEFTASFVDIRANYGATSTIMTEYLLEAHKIFPARLATALLYGIETDTSSLQRISTDLDINAFRFLLGKADMSLLRVIRLSRFPLSALSYFAVAALQKRYSKGIIYSNLGFVDTTDILSHIAAFLMEFHNINWAIVSGLYRDTLIIVFRSDGYKKDAGRLATRAFGKIGSAGGHATMARAEVQLSQIQEKLPNMSSEAVEKFVLERLAPHLQGIRRLQQSEC